MPNVKIDWKTEDEHNVDAAAELYAAYAANSDGKTFDGRDMPTWDGLNDAVRSHWCAVWLASQRLAAQQMA